MRFIKCVVKPAILLRRRLEGMVATSSVIFLLTLPAAPDGTGLWWANSEPFLKVIKWCYNSYSQL